MALWDRDPQALARARAALGAAAAVEVDVTDWDQVQRAAQQSFAVLGRIDILVAGAGITGSNAPQADYPIADWAQVININLTGAFLGCRALVPYMLRNNYGRIVNISSVAGKKAIPTRALIRPRGLALHHVHGNRNR